MKFKVGSRVLSKNHSEISTAMIEHIYDTTDGPIAIIAYFTNSNIPKYKVPLSQLELVHDEAVFISKDNFNQAAAKTIEELVMRLREIGIEADMIHYNHKVLGEFANALRGELFLED